MEDILIFKTNVNSTEHLQWVDTLFASVEWARQWTVDIEDCDRVLRVVGINLVPERIENLLDTAGIRCEHMAYE